MFVPARLACLEVGRRNQAAPDCAKMEDIEDDDKQADRFAGDNKTF